MLFLVMMVKILFMKMDDHGYGDQWSILVIHGDFSPPAR